MTVDVTVHLRTRSEANLREHWAKRAERAKKHRETTRRVLRATAAPFLPCTVRLTRIAPRELDDDNLRGATKFCRDGVADWLGVNDRDRRVTWEYGQAKGRVREYAVRVEVFAAPMLYILDEVPSGHAAANAWVREQTRAKDKD